MLTECLSLATTLPCVLIFSHISERDGGALLNILASTLKSRKIVLQCVIITTYNQKLDGIDDVGELDLGVITPSVSLMYVQTAAFDLQTLSSLMK